MDEDVAMPDADDLAAEHARRKKAISKFYAIRVNTVKSKSRLLSICPAPPEILKRPDWKSPGGPGGYARHNRRLVGEWKQALERENRRYEAVKKQYEVNVAAREVARETRRLKNKFSQKRLATEDQGPDAKRRRVTQDRSDKCVPSQPPIEFASAASNNVLRRNTDIRADAAASGFIRSTHFAVQQCIRSGVQIATAIRRRFESSRGSQDCHTDHDEDDGSSASAQLKVELTEHIAHSSSLSHSISELDEQCSAQLQAELIHHTSSFVANFQTHITPSNAANLVLQDQQTIQDVMTTEDATSGSPKEEAPPTSQEVEGPAEANDEAKIQDEAPDYEYVRLPTFLYRRGSLNSLRERRWEEEETRDVNPAPMPDIPIVDPVFPIVSVEPVIGPPAESAALEQPLKQTSRPEEHDEVDKGDYEPGVPPLLPHIRGGFRRQHQDSAQTDGVPVTPVLTFPAPTLLATPLYPHREIEEQVEETAVQFAGVTVGTPSNEVPDCDPTGRTVNWLARATPWGSPVSAVQMFNVSSPPISMQNRTPSLLQAEWQAIEVENRRKEEEWRKKQRERLIDEKRKSLGRLRVPAGEDVVRPFSDDWNERLQKVMSGPLHRTLVSTLEGAELTKQKLETCYTIEAWLNDEVINGHLALTVDYLRRVADNQGPRVQPKYYAFNSFFYKKLRESGHEGVARWTRRAKIAGKALLDVELLFIPVHQDSHWTLLVLSPKNRTIEYFDSLWTRNHPFVSNIKKWLQGELGELYDEEEWFVLNSQSPRQDNSSDCGVFLLTTAKAIALGLEPTQYGPTDIPLIRRKIVAELLNGGLQGDFEPAGTNGEKRL